jgi:hypothetical protein
MARRLIDVQWMAYRANARPTRDELKAIALVEDKDNLACRIYRQLGSMSVRVGTIKRHVQGAQEIKWRDIPFNDLDGK